MVKLSADTIATPSATVLGLLVSSAKDFFDTMNNGMMQSSGRIIRLDEANRREVFINLLVWISSIPERTSS